MSQNYLEVYTVNPDKVAAALRRAASADEPGQLIATARKFAGWSRRELYERLALVDDPSCTQETVALWEVGAEEPMERHRSRMRSLANRLEKK